MISIILPLKNEEEIIYSSLNILLSWIRKIGIKVFEVICVLNGITDNTEREIRKVNLREIKIFKSKLGYGHALIKGIKKSNGDILVVLNADLIDENILRFAKNNLIGFDLVIGSKRTFYSIDRRSLLRKTITLLFNLFLKIFLNFRGSDTHGIKAFKKRDALKIIKILEKNKIEFNDIFDSLMVLGFDLFNKKILEYPIKVKEIRPSRFKKRIIYFWHDLFLLIRAYFILKKESKKNFNKYI